MTATSTVTASAAMAAFPVSPIALGTLLVVELWFDGVAEELGLVVSTLVMVLVWPAVAETEMMDPLVMTEPGRR